MTREIEALGFDNERFDEMDREFEHFLKEIVGNHLDKFKTEY
jgi:hypothetical protein